MYNDSYTSIQEVFYSSPELRAVAEKMRQEKAARQAAIDARVREVQAYIRERDARIAIQAMGFAR